MLIIYGVSAAFILVLALLVSALVGVRITKDIKLVNGNLRQASMSKTH